MSVLVPPAIFDEVQAVFYLPMASHVFEEFLRRDGLRVEAGDEVTRFSRAWAATVGGVPVDSHEHAATGKTQPFADINGVVQVDPKKTSFSVAPFFFASSAEFVGEFWLG